MDVDTIMAKLLGEEGGYTDNPSDPGGETNFGITKAVARANGFEGDMRAMTQDDAKSIYRRIYFEAPHFDDVFDVSPGIAAELFDTGVNMGVATAAQFLQRSLNAFTPHCLADGQIGPGTMACLKSFLANRGDAGEHALLKAMNCLQGERYIALAEKNPHLKSFTFGWITNRVDLSA